MSLASRRNGGVNRTGGGDEDTIMRYWGRKESCRWLGHGMTLLYLDMETEIRLGCER